MPELSFVEIALSAIAVLIFLALVLMLVALFKKNAIYNELEKNQSELVGRLAQMSQYASLEQNKIAQAITEQKLSLLNIIDQKLMQVAQNVGTGLQQSTAKTNETLMNLRERLAKIDSAQQKISSLSEQVVSLQEILSNKQARGAFGEIQLHDLVTSVLPPSVYEFQYVLSNQKRADCILKLPNPPGVIAIDSKFPLESYQALRQATTDKEKTDAERFFKASLLKHIKDIAEKYIISGETAESALMFIPAESVYAELHANFTDVVQESYKARVWIVSPTTMMAVLNTIRAVLKDVTMQQQAGIIQKEVGLLMADVKRLDERAENLSRHFEQSMRDVEEIRTSSAKIINKAGKIEMIEFDQNSEDSVFQNKKVV